jgi:hypothetical protein
MNGRMGEWGNGRLRGLETQTWGQRIVRMVRLMNSATS